MFEEISDVIVKIEVTSEVEEETKKRRRDEWQAGYIREKRELVKKICAGEDVGEEERRKIVEAEETRIKMKRKRIRTDEERKVRAEYQRKRMERRRRIAAGEEVDGVGEEERKRIIEAEEKRKRNKREKNKREREAERAKLVEKVKTGIGGGEVDGLGEEERRRIIEAEETRKKKTRERIRTDEQRKAKAEYERKRLERKRRIAAGEEVDGVGEEERWKIIEEEETREKKERERRKVRAANERKRMERKRRIAAGEEVDGVGEEERKRIIEGEERRKRCREGYRRRLKEQTEEEMEKRREKQRFLNLVRTVTRTKEEREEISRKSYFRSQARLAMMSKEEREEKRKRFNENFKKWRNSLDEEKRRKHYEGVKRSVRKYHEKMKERDPEGYRERLNKYQRGQKERQRELWERMDGEEKRRRLNQMKMNQQKRRLRRELEGMGEGEEEIERRVGELDKRLREELGIGPPRRTRRASRRNMGGEKEDGKEATCSKSVDCSEKVANLKEEVEAPPPSTIAEVSPAVPDITEEEENEFCDFDDGPMGIPSPESLPPPPSPPAVLAPITISKVVEVKFTCKYCKSPPFSTEEDLKDHLRAEHLKICWKCPKCKEVVLSGKHLSQHFKDKHKKPSEENISLPTAQEAVPATTTQRIKKDQSEEKGGAGDEGRSKVEFLCLRCPWQPEKSSNIIKVFKCWRELQSHVKLKHRKYYWPCEYCHLLKYSKQSLIVHLILCRNKPKDKS